MDLKPHLRQAQKSAYFAGSFDSIKKWATKSICGILLVAICVGAFAPSFGGQTAFPQAAAEDHSFDLSGSPCHIPGTPGTANNGVYFGATCKSLSDVGLPSDASLKLGQLASFIVQLASPLIAFEAVMIGSLMGNDFIMGDGAATDTTVKSVDGLLLQIWRVMRDIVNYAFILVLLAIAFMTVVSAGGGITGGSSFQLGKAFPKFVIAMILVNLTWFGARVVLDAANVASHIVYSIPMSIPNHETLIRPEGVGEGTCVMPSAAPLKEGERRCPTVCRHITIKAPKGGKIEPGALLPGAGGTPVETATAISYGLMTLDQCEKFNWEQYGANTIASLFAFSFLQVQHLPMTAGFEGDLLDITIHSLVALLIVCLLAIVFTALFFVLLERIVILWINIILSPFAVLLWVLSDTFSVRDPTNDIIGFKAFVKYAFLPALLGIPLTVGFIMIIVGDSIPMPDIFPVTITNLDTIVPNIHDLHQLIWFIIAIVVMWMSMTIAEKEAHFTKGAISMIKSSAEGVAKFVVQSPMYAPLIPIKTADGTTVGKGAVADIFAMGSGMGNFWKKRQSERMGTGGYDKDVRKIINQFDGFKPQIASLLADLEKGGKWDETVGKHLSTKLSSEELTKMKSASESDKEAYVKGMLATQPSKDPNEYRKYLGGAAGTQKFDFVINGTPITISPTSTNAEDVYRSIKQAFDSKGIDKNKEIAAKDFHDMLTKSGTIKEDRAEEIAEYLRTRDGYKIGKKP